MYSPIEFKQGRSRAFQDALEISAIKDGQIIGHLDYSPLSPDEFYIAMIEANLKGQRIGTLLIHELLKSIGPKKKVSGSIVHAETWEYFDQAGLLEQVVINKLISLSEKDSIRLVPIAQFLINAGLSVNQVVIESIDNPEETYHNLVEYRSIRERWLSEGEPLNLFASYFFSSELWGET